MWLVYCPGNSSSPKTCINIRPLMRWSWPVSLDDQRRDRCCFFPSTRFPPAPNYQNTNTCWSESVVANWFRIILLYLFPTVINPVSVIRLYNCPEMTLVYNAANGSSTINYILMWPFLCCYCPVGLDHQRRDHWRYCLSSTFQRAPNHQDKNTYRLESVVVNNFRIFLG